MLMWKMRGGQQLEVRGELKLWVSHSDRDALWGRSNPLGGGERDDPLTIPP